MAERKQAIDHMCSERHLMDRLRHDNQWFAILSLENILATIGTLGKWDNLKRINSLKNKLEHRVEKKLKRLSEKLFSVGDAVLICINT